jgi:hypothetical protein
MLERWRLFIGIAVTAVGLPSGVIGGLNAWDDYRTKGISQKVMQCEVAMLKRAVFHGEKPTENCYEIVLTRPN